MAWVVLISSDWKTRALIRAQLIEEGLDVEAHDGARNALAQLEGSGPAPELLVADISTSDDPAADIDELGRLASRMPIWIIAGRALKLKQLLESRGFERILFRPIDLGELVERIRRRVGE